MTGVCGVRLSAVLGVQAANENLEGQKRWLLAKVLEQEVALEARAQAEAALESELDDAADTIRRLEAKVFPPHFLLLFLVLAYFAPFRMPLAETRSAGADVFSARV